MTSSDYHINIPLFYMAAFTPALRALSGFTRHDFNILAFLYHSNYPVHYRRLERLLITNQNGLNSYTYSKCVKRLISLGYITRVEQGGNVLYDISVLGKQQLIAFCQLVEQNVQQRIMRYADQQERNAACPGKL